eukprot:3940880-Rhodomonas_salina.5
MSQHCRLCRQCERNSTGCCLVEPSSPFLASAFAASSPLTYARSFKSICTRHASTQCVLCNPPVQGVHMERGRYAATLVMHSLPSLQRMLPKRTWTYSPLDLIAKRIPGIGPLHRARGHPCAPNRRHRPVLERRRKAHSAVSTVR